MGMLDLFEHEMTWVWMWHLILIQLVIHSNMVTVNTFDYLMLFFLLVSAEWWTKSDASRPKGQDVILTSERTYETSILEFAWGLLVSSYCI